MDFGDSRIPDRIWDKVHPEPNTGCWLWSGARQEEGYGRAKRYSRRDKRPTRNAAVHRWLLEIATGESGVQARHQCRQPPCVNPAHLLWGTNSDNHQDSVRDGTQHCARRTHCPLGHEFTEENTYWRAGPKRVCLICKRDQDRLNARRYRARRKETA